MHDGWFGSRALHLFLCGAARPFDGSCLRVGGRLTLLLGSSRVKMLIEACELLLIQLGGTSVSAGSHGAQTVRILAGQLSESCK